MRTVFLTGGCGFIGSNFVRLVCRERRWRVVILDKLTYSGAVENLEGIDEKRYRLVEGDICDRSLIERLLQEERPWAIINFAAESHVDRSILDSSPFIQTNVTGVQILLEAVRRYPVGRFLQISTDEVYGDRAGKEPSLEETPLLPSSPYAASKAAADLLCGSYRRTYSLPIIITRSSNNYGPYQFPEKLIPLLTHNALNGLTLPVYGDGQQVRDWLYVEDNCQAILAVLEKGCIGSNYNIGSGEERTNLEVVQTICMAIAQHTGANLNKLKGQVKLVPDRPGHDRRYILNTDKIRYETGWAPKTPFAGGIQRTIRWYIDHQDWTSRAISGEYRSYYESIYARAWQSRHINT